MSLPGFTASNSVYSSTELYKNLIVYHTNGLNVQMSRGSSTQVGMTIGGLLGLGIVGGIGGFGLGAFIGFAIGGLLDGLQSLWCWITDCDK